MYNDERPHEALGLVPPAAFYRPSPRLWCGTAPEPVYGDDLAPRRVKPRGQIKWRGKTIYVGLALAGELVAMAEQETGWQVNFASLPLGLIDNKALTSGKISPIPKPVDKTAVLPTARNKNDRNTKQDKQEQR